MRLKLGVSLLLVCFASLVVAQVGSAHQAQAHRPVYVTELKIGNVLESKGVSYHGRHINIESALCSGLRYRGVRPNPYGLDRYWQFDCDLDAVNGHFYEARISTTTGPRRGYYYWHQLSIKLEF
jgi:hypothetical protein